MDRYPFNGHYPPLGPNGPSDPNSPTPTNPQTQLHNIQDSLMAIIFENEGSIDPRAITTQGISVKTPNQSAIGYFGTGIKHAIAVLLRHGQGIIIHTGGRVYTFTLAQAIVRGKEFSIVCMNGQELGFTTEFGRDWELWMAYRELWSNAIDESGRVYQAEDLPDAEGRTQIVVDGIEFDQVHAERYEFLLLDRTPIYKNSTLEIYNGQSEFVFYHGIRAGKVPAGKRSRFTYNFIDTMKLTEDRTLAYSWEVQSNITAAALGSDNKDYLISALTETDEDVLEFQLDYDQTYTQASQSFIETVQRLQKSKSGRINDKAVKKFIRQTHKNITPEGRPITAAEAQTLELARSLAERLGFPNRDYEIRVADELGDGVQAIAIMKELKLVLTGRIIAKGVPMVAQAIIEESVHLRHGFGDCSRAMQTYLFEQIIRLGLAAVA